MDVSVRHGRQMMTNPIENTEQPENCKRFFTEGCFIFWLQRTFYFLLLLTLILKGYTRLADFNIIYTSVSDKGFTEVAEVYQNVEILFWFQIPQYCRKNYLLILNLLTQCALEKLKCPCLLLCYHLKYF